MRRTAFPARLRERLEQVEPTARFSAKRLDMCATPSGARTMLVSPSDQPHPNRITLGKARAKPDPAWRILRIAEEFQGVATFLFRQDRNTAAAGYPAATDDLLSGDADRDVLTSCLQCHDGVVGPFCYGDCHCAENINREPTNSCRDCVEHRVRPLRRGRCILLPVNMQDVNFGICRSELHGPAIAVSGAAPDHDASWARKQLRLSAGETHGSRVAGRSGPSMAGS